MVTKDEVAEWMRAHPGAALQLAIDTEVLHPMRAAMWCDKHGGGHPIDAEHLYEYGPETCHVHPLLWAGIPGPICPECRHHAFTHAGGRCRMAERLDDGTWTVCECLSPIDGEDDLPFDVDHGFDYRQWVERPTAHEPIPPWVGI